MYYVYAVVIAVTSALSIMWEIYIAKKNENSLRELLPDEQWCTVLRDGQAIKISATHLVVGDAVLINETGPAVADMVLIQGSCVVDDSSLTGESVPVVKVSLGVFEKRGEKYSPERCKTSMIYGGSKIEEIKKMQYELSTPGEPSRVVGVVTATGFNSTKGELFRSIIFPTKIVLPINYYSYSSSFLFIITTRILNFIETHLNLLVF